MVSMDGAKNVAPLLDEIAALTAAVEGLKGGIAAGATIWQMSADAYIEEKSRNFKINYPLDATASAAILTSVQGALQARLDAAEKALAGIA